MQMLTITQTTSVMLRVDWVDTRPPSDVDTRPPPPPSDDAADRRYVSLRLSATITRQLRQTSATVGTTYWQLMNRLMR